MLDKSRAVTHLVIRLPNWVGDVCMVMPSLALLAKAGLPLTLCGKPFAQSLVRSLPNHRFILLNGSLTADLRTVRQALPCSGAGTRGLLFPDSLSSALLFRLSGIASLGYRDDGRSIFLRWPLDKPQTDGHAVLKWYALARKAIDIWQLNIGQPAPDVPEPFILEPSQQARAQIREVLQANQLRPQEYFLLAPTATGQHKGREKVWPGFAKLARALVRKGHPVIACPPEHERDQVLRAAPDARLLDPLDLDAFCELARQAKLVVCNDSGVSHLSALVGAKQLTLFGVTDPARTGPWSSQATCLGELNAWPNEQEVLDKCLSLTQPDSQKSHASFSTV